MVVNQWLALRGFQYFNAIYICTQLVIKYLKCTFLMVKWQNILKSFCRVVGTIYAVLSILFYWLSDCVGDQGLHVSSFVMCHRCDACVMCLSHWLGLCITSIAVRKFWHCMNDLVYILAWS